MGQCSSYNGQNTSVSTEHDVSLNDRTGSESKLKENPNVTLRERNTMSHQNMSLKKPLQTRRPTGITTAFLRPDVQREEGLETKYVKSTPALKTVFMGFEDCIKFMEDQGKRDEKCFSTLNDMLKSKVIEPFVKFEKDEIRTVLGNKLAKIGFVKPLWEYYIFILDETGITAVTNSLFYENDDVTTCLIKTIRTILWNYSDGSLHLTEVLADTDIFERLLNDLEEILDEGLQELEAFSDLSAFSSAVCILYNCSKNSNIEREKFRNHNATGILKHFLDSELLYVKMITLLALGNIIKEDEVPTLATNTDVFDFLIDAMKTAIAAKDRKCYGFHLNELADGLASLAQSDKNKDLIMSKNPLMLIKKILEQGKNTGEILAGVKLIWQLAFLEKNKQIILKEKNLVAIVEGLKCNTHYGIQFAATKAWFVLVGIDQKAQEDAVEPLKKVKHIMISYNWGDQEMVLKIYEDLINRGLPIWIDIHEMNKFPNILDGMSHAIEEASVVLICFSEKYKSSQNCRTEAEYAYKMKKEIVPLKMQRGYNPDGWLGAILGTRLYIEFSPQKPFEKQIEMLVESLPRAGSHVLDARPNPAKPSSRDRPRTRQASFVDQTHTLKDWKKPDVEAWAKKHGMGGGAFKKVTQLTGEQLLFVYEVYDRSPSTFYTWAESKFFLGSIEELTKFNNAIKSLRSYT